MNLGLEGIVITCEVKAVVPKMFTIEDAKDCGLDHIVSRILDF